MSDTLVRRATADDAVILGVVAPATYAAAYSHMWNDAAALARRLTSFGEAEFRDWMAAGDTRTWVALMDDAIVGFLTMRLASADPVTDEHGGAELERLYLLPQTRRMGLGRRLFEVSRAEAIAAGASYVWLDAMDTAPWALVTYGDWGFRRIGAKRLGHGIAAEHDAMSVMRLDLCGIDQAAAAAPMP